MSTLAQPFTVQIDKKKKLYCQIAITMKGGPMGKGVRIQHSKCIKKGIHTILPDLEATKWDLKTIE